MLPFHGGPVPDESRQKLIDEIRGDYENVLDQLSKADPGTDTRAKQKRILDNLDALLKQRNPNQGARSSSPPNPKGSSKPMPLEPTPSSTQGTADPKPVAVKPKPSGQEVDLSNTPNGVRNKLTGDNHWPTLPPRDRMEMEAFGRERFIRNYEELLRAYYRNLAENRRRADE